MPSSRQYLLAEQILAKWNLTGALAASCPGGVKFGITKQPADTSAISEPYCNFTIDIASEKKQAGTGVIVVTAMVKFEVYGSVSLNVSNAIGDIQAAFTYGQSLANPTGGNFISMTTEPGDDISPEMWSRGGRINKRATHTAKVVFSL
jgi:hypothetical protein